VTLGKLGYSLCFVKKKIETEKKNCCRPKKIQSCDHLARLLLKRGLTSKLRVLGKKESTEERWGRKKKDFKARSVLKEKKSGPRTRWAPGEKAGKEHPDIPIQSLGPDGKRKGAIKPLHSGRQPLGKWLARLGRLALRQARGREFAEQARTRTNRKEVTTSKEMHERRRKD